MYNTTTQMDSSSALPQPATMPESLLSFYQSNFCDPNKADSGLTYHIPLQRKRSRDFTTELTSLPAHQKNKISSESSFLNQEILYQFQNQQSEIDRVLAHHVSFHFPSLYSINFSFFFFKKIQIQDKRKLFIYESGFPAVGSFSAFTCYLI